jgi:hypothetical protein
MAMTEDAVEVLLDRYYEEAAVNGPGVLRFIDQILGGAWGAVDRLVVLAFLDRLETVILANIETRLEEAPGDEEAAQAAWEETRREFAAARERVLT